MIDECIMKKLLLKMKEDINSNIINIKKEFENLNYKDDEGQSLLHLLVDDKYNEEKCFMAIESLLKFGLNPNLEDCFNYNFIQTALYTGYSEKFILKIINESLKYNLNVNHVDSDNDTIMHTAIYSDNYLGGLEKIYGLLCANGFDSSLEDNYSRDLVEAMIYQNQYSKEQIESFKKLFKREHNINSNDINNTKKTQRLVRSELPLLSDNDIFTLEKYGNILNKKDYLVSPTIGREKELKNLIVTLAQDKKRPLIVGESGVGKTAIVDELAYRIKIGQVPKFLQGKIILEINPSEIVAGCRYVGMFEDNMTKLMKLCKKLDVIVFINEIHTIYGIGSTKNNDNDMASMLKHYIDRSNLKVIGTTTEKEYQEFFSNDALKRRFEKITVKEPAEDILYQIVNKVIGDFSLKNSILFENENIRSRIINIILSATEKSHRVYNDMVNNPDLVISIVDKAFAFAKVYDSEFITLQHFIESLECCDRIYESTKEKTIESLIDIDSNVSKSTSKVLKIDFNKFKR